MTGNSAFFYDLKKCFLGYVTIKDEAKGKVLGKDNIFKPNLQKLQDVRLVKGL